ncbi:hypothetical protein PAXRUDRAFT_638702, partial [Paxillus rubicundulus Ve08.2h10]
PPVFHQKSSVRRSSPTNTCHFSNLTGLHMSRHCYYLLFDGLRDMSSIFVGHGQKVRPERGLLLLYLSDNICKQKS